MAVYYYLPTTVNLKISIMVGLKLYSNYSVNILALGYLFGAT
jgi:hypothetical protein